MGDRSLSDIKQAVQDARDKLPADAPLPDDVRVLMGELFAFHDELEKRDCSMKGTIVSLMDDMSQTNESLAETGMRLEGILEAAEDVAFIFADTPDGDCHDSCKIIEFSRGARQLFGYERDEVMGRSPAMFFGQGVPEKGNIPSGDRWVMRRKSGEFFPALLSLYPLKNPHGDVIAQVLIASDLSRQEQAEQLFKEAHGRYEALALVAPVSIMAFDAEGTITFVNDWHMRVYDGRFQPELYIGKNIAEVSSLVRAGVTKSVLKVLQGRSVSLEDVFVPGFGDHEERWQNIRSSPIMEGDEVKGGIIIREEVTRRKQTEIDLKAVIDNSPIPLLKVELVGGQQIINSLNPEAVAVLGRDAVNGLLDAYITPMDEEGEELSDMNGQWCEMQTVDGVRQCIRTVAAMGKYYEIHAVMDVSPLIQAKRAAEEADQIKTDFLSNISHEIRTPLNVLLGMLQFFRDTDMGAELNEMAEYAAGAGQSLLSLLNDILDFAALSSGPVSLGNKAFDVAELVDLVCIPYRVQAREKGVELTVSIAEDVPRQLKGDPRRLRQSIFHLVGNSVKFTDKGSVHVQVMRAGSGSCDGRCMVEFRVTDTGIGIDEDKMAVIFEPFRQGDGSRTRRHGGTGIGLALVHEFARAMGGDISFVSEPGTGTEARLSVDVGME